MYSIKLDQSLHDVSTENRGHGSHITVVLKFHVGEQDDPV
jgi:hypothetical protein